MIIMKAILINLKKNLGQITFLNLYHIFTEWQKEH